MKGTQLAALAATAIALAACAPTQYSSSAGGQIDWARWTATLAAPPDGAGPAAPSVTGTATLAPGDSISLTRATVQISGATPGASYPWGVHLGRCGEDKGIVGISSMYRPIAVGADGRGEATVVLPYTTPNQGEFFVTVRAPGRASGVVACGNLAQR